MNDFTKEELIKLKNGLEYLPNSVSMSKKYWDGCENIINKLQSMIENYCEHENAGRDYSCNRCWDCGECW